jgi:hypothetical protein
MMKGRLRDLTINRDGTQNVTVTVSSDFTTTFESLKDAEIDVDIKKAGKGRSRDANAFCWALCAEIGKALKPPQSKEDIYRMAIKAVGVFTEVVLYAWDVKTVLRRWAGHGTGWIADVVDDAGTGKKVVHLYYGSSTYSVDEMRVLIEWLEEEARQMELPIPLSKKEEEALLERWGKK